MTSLWRIFGPLFTTLLLFIEVCWHSSMKSCRSCLSTEHFCCWFRCSFTNLSCASMFLLERRGFLIPSGISLLLRWRHSFCQDGWLQVFSTLGGCTWPRSTTSISVCIWLLVGLSAAYCLHYQVHFVTRTHTYTLSLSLTHTHARTRTHTHAHTQNTRRVLICTFVYYTFLFGFYPFIIFSSFFLPCSFFLLFSYFSSLLPVSLDNTILYI